MKLEIEWLIEIWVELIRYCVKEVKREESEER